jgi:hypothetical protein
LAPAYGGEDGVVLLQTALRPDERLLQLTQLTSRRQVTGRINKLFKPFSRDGDRRFFTSCFSLIKKTLPDAMINFLKPFAVCLSKLNYYFTF